MKIVERPHIDIEKWNQLVGSSEDASVFSRSWYLDATAENWCVLVDDTYTSGIALPYSTRLGVKKLYTPIFVRYIQWLGVALDFAMLSDLIKQQFSCIDVSIKQPVLGADYTPLVYQRIEINTERKLGSQAKRSLKKAMSNNLEVVRSTDYTTVESIITDELVGKYNGINAVSMKALSKLFELAKAEQACSVYEIKGHGGVVCISDQSSVLYLKGTVSTSCKHAGGMYACLDLAINEAVLGGKQFDFGGSRIEGVKRFNHNLGGKDVTYFGYTFDNAPIWFKLARRIKDRWIKK
ncbi:MAG: hypothetical protein P8N52_01400 [Crocinitomicaceae bacterium]|nr:hypothetical protein [Crocinitomicaceae bacterium]MDG1776829.1 hypothetical protein [Crocinitomicaceae bacterium]